MNDTMKELQYDDEDAIDAAIAEEAYREYVESGYKSTPISELWRELDEEELHRPFDSVEELMESLNSDD